MKLFGKIIINLFELFFSITKSFVCNLITLNVGLIIDTFLSQLFFNTGKWVTRNKNVMVQLFRKLFIYFLFISACGFLNHFISLVGKIHRCINLWQTPFIALVETKRKVTVANTVNS